MGSYLSSNTIKKRCGNAKLFFRSAVRHELVASNPFADLPSSVGGNPDREYFVTRDEIEKVLEACPDITWRLIFALARYCGLRIPTEALALRWQDINWQEGKIHITSPKTAHHEGKGSRMVPLFPEIRPILLEAFDQAQEGAEHVITHYRNSTCNLRTHAHRITKRAGLTPWPKTFQNLRSSRETELIEQWPAHIVCAWIGHTKKVAQEHYLQVTDEHYERAAGAAQNAAQYPAEQACTGEKADSEDNQETVILPCVTRKFLSMQDLPLGRAGFEPA